MREFKEAYAFYKTLGFETQIKGNGDREKETRGR